MVSDAGLLPWYERMRAEVPGLDVFDVHTHIGSNDPDGYSCTRAELVEKLDSVDASAFVFPMHEPDGYSAANDMVAAEAAASDGRLLPFCRLDPKDDPLAEARRCLDAGARGIKLHPRAEGFNLDHPALAGRVRARRRAPHPDPLPRRARDPGARPPRRRGLRAPPRAAPDPRPRRHLGPVLDLARGARPPEPALRHRLVVAERHPGAVRAGAARSDPDGERRALRHARVRRDDGDPPRAPGRARRGRDPRHRRRPGAQARRARGAARPRARAGHRVAHARPAARARLLLPAERDRPDVRRRRADRDAGARLTGLRPRATRTRTRRSITRCCR